MNKYTVNLYQVKNNPNIKIQEGKNGKLSYIPYYFDFAVQVASQLENEEINQVGSFVWTHLTNLMESSNPHKLEISKILENKDLKKEFNLGKNLNILYNIGFKVCSRNATWVGVGGKIFPSSPPLGFFFSWEHPLTQEMESDCHPRLMRFNSGTALS